MAVAVAEVAVAEVAEVVVVVAVVDTAAHRADKAPVVVVLVVVVDVDAADPAVTADRPGVKRQKKPQRLDGCPTFGVPFNRTVFSFWPLAKTSCKICRTFLHVRQK